MTDPLIKFVESVCVQTACYWGNPVSDGYGGTTYDTPVEISCRWDGNTQLVTNNQGEEVVSKAEILLTQDVDEGGLLFLGDLDDLTPAEEAAPETVDTAWKIIRFDKTPLFQSTDEFVRKAYL